MAVARLLSDRFPSSSTVFFPDKGPLPPPLLKDRSPPPPPMSETYRTSFFLHMPRQPSSSCLKDYLSVPYGTTKIRTPLSYTRYMKNNRGERDATVGYKHKLCNTHTTRRVDKESLEKGLVIIRCRGCDDLVIVVDHRRCFTEGATQETIEKFVTEFLSVDVPPKESNGFICATFESYDEWQKTESKMYKDKVPDVYDYLLPLLGDFDFHPDESRRDGKAHSGSITGSSSKPQRGKNRRSIHKVQPGKNEGSNPEEQSRTNGGSNPEEQSGTNGGSVAIVQPGLKRCSNPKAQSGTNSRRVAKEEKRKKPKKKKKSHEKIDKTAGENINNTEPALVLVQNGGSDHRTQKEMNEGSIPEEQSGRNGGSMPEELPGTKRGSVLEEQSEMNGGRIPEEQPEMNGGSIPEEQPDMNGGSISEEQLEMNGVSNHEEQSGTNGGSIPEEQSRMSGGGKPKGEEKNNNSQKEKKSHETTEQSAGEDNTTTTSSSGPEFNPEFVLVRNGGSIARDQPEMNGGSNAKEQSGTNRGVIPKAQPGTSGGSNPEAKSGRSGGITPEEEQKKKTSEIDNSKNKEKSHAETDQYVADNSKNNVSFCPALSPELLLVENPDRDATLAFTHPLCNTQSERRVSKEAFQRGVVVVRCGGCGDLVAVADHANWFGEDAEHENVERLLGFVGVNVPKGSEQSFCATFESKDCPKTDGAEDRYKQKEFEDLQLEPDVSYQERPLCILDRWERVTYNQTIPFVKILWSNPNKHEESWELEDDMREQYPELFS